MIILTSPVIVLPSQVLQRPTRQRPTLQRPTRQCITPPLPAPAPFEIGENVCARWKKGQWFLAQVTNYDDVSDQYTVYFVEDSLVKHNLARCDLREVDTTYPTRREMLGRDFFFDGAEDLPEGMWRVRRLISDHDMYECCRLTGSGNQNVEKFDIGYVMIQYMKGISDNRGRVLSDTVRHS